MGIPSPYLRIAFPNDSGREYLEYLDMQLPPEDLAHWKKGLATFLRSYAQHRDRRLILKSPTHTGRLRLLAEMFPDAKFVHISRDPYDVVPSTIRLWKSLEYVQALQSPNYEHLPDYVFRAYRRMYDGYFEASKEIDPDRLLEIRYESLVDDAPKLVQRIYDYFELGDFDRIRPSLLENLEARKGYQKNKHELDSELVQQINEHWSDYFAHFGYTKR
jgi:hypothetical protein